MGTQVANFRRRKPSAATARLGSFAGANHLVLGCIFSEGAGGSIFDLGGSVKGSTNDGTYVAAWDFRSPRFGRTIGFDSVASSRRINFGEASYVPTSAITIIFGYRKRDSTLRAAGAFGISNPFGGTRAMGALVPYSDGTVYWDFGGTSDGTTRLHVSGLTFGDDVWCFSTGPRGMEIVQNGVVKASNSATPSRSPVLSGVGSNLLLGDYLSSGNDIADFSFFYLFDTQLSPEIIRALSSSPFLLLRSSSRAILTSVGGSSTFNFTGTGGVVLSGSASKQPTYNPAPSGGTLIGGSHTLSSIFNPSAAGGVVIAGAAVESASYSPAVAGGAIASGSAVESVTYSPATSGGVVIAGQAVTSSGGTFNVIGSGGASASGSANVSSSFSFSASGRVVAGASAATSMVFVQTSAGGMLVGGSAIAGLAGAHSVIGPYSAIFRLSVFGAK